jgi:hypothetical protein
MPSESSQYSSVRSAVCFQKAATNSKELAGSFKFEKRMTCNLSKFGFRQTTLTSAPNCCAANFVRLRSVAPPVKWEMLVLSFSHPSNENRIGRRICFRSDAEERYCLQPWGQRQHSDRSFNETVRHHPHSHQQLIETGNRPFCRNTQRNPRTSQHGVGQQYTAIGCRNFH